MLKLKHPLILASSSPRRKEILEMVGLQFTVIPSTYEEPEHSDHLTAPEVFAEEVTLGKGQEVFERTSRSSFVLSADTLGIIGDQVLEKPKDRDDAHRMLELMSGKQHTVLTVVALFSPENSEPQIEHIKTAVHFRELSREEIHTYLDQEEYLDKAAAYAIQGRASIFVKKIVGDYFNVVGLPISTVWSMLQKAQRDKQ